MSRVIFAATIVGLAAAVPVRAGDLTTFEVRLISAKIGMRLEIGYGHIGWHLPINALAQMTPLKPTRPATAPAEEFRWSAGTESMDELPGTGMVTWRAYQPPEFSGQLTDEQRREKRSYAIFPRAHLDADENAKREAWIAEQEQREIANRINASKPLLFPVNSR
jgi:hypothetical protein